MTLVVAGIIFVFDIISIVCSSILLEGIKERNARKVRAYKYFLVVSLALFILEDLLILVQFKMPDQFRVIYLVGQVVIAIIAVLLIQFMICVVYSLEMLYKEQQLPMAQDAITVFQPPQRQFYYG